MTATGIVRVLPTRVFPGILGLFTFLEGGQPALFEPYRFPSKARSPPTGSWTSVVNSVVSSLATVKRAATAVREPPPLPEVCAEVYPETSGTKHHVLFRKLHLRSRYCACQTLSVNSYFCGVL